MCFAPQRRALFRHLNLQKWSEPLVFCTFWLGNVLRATTACTFSTSELPKVVRTPSVLYILTWKCASCHNGVHFSDIATSKSGPNVVCFVHFDLEMCFAPQRRALFRHLNFLKCSETQLMFKLTGVSTQPPIKPKRLQKGYKLPTQPGQHIDFVRKHADLRAW